MKNDFINVVLRKNDSGFMMYFAEQQKKFEIKENSKIEAHFERKWYPATPESIEGKFILVANNIEVPEYTLLRLYGAEND